MRTTCRTIAISILCALPIAFAQTPPAKGAGHWEGTLKAPQQEIPILLDLTKGPTGLWAGTFSIPVASAVDLPLSKITVGDTALRFVVADLPGAPAFDAKFSEDGVTLSGTATNGVAPIQFELKRTDSKATIKAAQRSSPLTKEFEGTWGGAIDPENGTPVRIALELTRAADGTASGRLIILDQGNQAISVTTVTIRESMLQLEVRGIAASYVGVIKASGQIEGTWTQGATNAPLNLERAKVEGKK
ncbi:MAG: hypothetical protein ABI824_11165 [Acidobacteriota bacterium]